MKIIDAKPYNGMEAYGYGDSTVVLERCACGYHNTGAYAGKWELADFLKTENEIEVLEKAMR